MSSLTDRKLRRLYALALVQGNVVVAAAALDELERREDKV